MRKYKIRGKSIEDLKWVKGYLYAYNQGFRIEDEWWANDVIPETLGQFTGKSDDGGDEIYEGDIITFEYDLRSFTGLIYWDDEEFAFMVDCPEQEGRFSLKEVDDAVTKIGNIYDNPYLLKGRRIK